MEIMLQESDLSYLSPFLRKSNFPIKKLFLGILLFHDYNVSRARGELQQYKPAETGIDAWDADDRTMFQTAYRLHAKSFSKIKG